MLIFVKEENISLHEDKPSSNPFKIAKNLNYLGTISK